MDDLPTACQPIGAFDFVALAQVLGFAHPGQDGTVAISIFPFSTSGWRT
jgi:hypothetical protein